MHYSLFLEWKLLIFKWNFIETCSLRSNWQQTIIGWDNRLSWNRRQAIISTNDGIVYRRIYLLLSLNELINIMHEYIKMWFGKQYFKIDYIHPLITDGSCLIIFIFVEYWKYSQIIRYWFLCFWGGKYCISIWGSMHISVNMIARRVVLD